MVRLPTTQKSQFVKTLYYKNLIYKNILNIITKQETKIKDLKKQYYATKNKQIRSKLLPKIRRSVTIFNKHIDALKLYRTKIEANKKLLKKLPKSKTLNQIYEFNKKIIEQPKKFVNYRFTVFFWSRGHNYRKKNSGAGKLRNRHRTFNIQGNFTLNEVQKMKSEYIDQYFSTFGGIYGIQEAKGTVNDIRNNTVQKIKITDFENIGGKNNDQAMERLVNTSDLEHYYHVIHTVKNVNLLIQAKGNILNMPVKYINYNKLPFDIEANNENIDENCVIHFFKKTLGKTKGFIKKIKKLNINDWTVEKLFNFLDSNNVMYKAYNQNLKIIKENKPTDHNNKLKTLTFILSNEHLYNVTKKELTHLFNVVGKRDTIKEIKYVEDAHKEVFNTIKEHPIKKLNISYDNDLNEAVDRYLSNDKLYTDDMYLMDIYKFAKNKFDFLPLSFNFSILTPLRLLLNNEHYSHVMNYMNIPVAVQYNDVHVYDCITIDKNKAYGYILENMEYIPKITFDHKIEKYDNQELDENNFYLVDEVNNYYYNMIHIGWQTGHSLANIPREYFNVSHYIVPTLVKNPLREYLRDLRNYSNDLYKTTYSIFSGMCLKSSVDSSLYYGNVTNSFEETGEFKNDYVTLNNNNNESLYVETFGSVPKENISKSLLPLGHYIFGNVKKILIDKINSLNELHKINVRTINTDSLTFSFDIYGSDRMKIDKAKNTIMDTLDKKDITGWKLENKQLCQHEYRPRNYKNYLIKEIPQIKMEEINEDILLSNNLLFNCNAGSGKTYYTLNSIIPILEKNDLSYIVLSTKHCIEKMYTEKNKNSKVIHTFLYNEKQKKKLGNYDYIIIDECGLLEDSHYKLLLEYMTQQQKLIFLGDYSQLSPIGHNAGEDSYINKQQIRKLFDYQTQIL